MIAGVYDIRVTGLGLFTKFGVLSIRTVDQQLSGTFTLHHREIPFNYGSFLGDKIELEGELALKIGTLGYTGKGIVTDGKLELFLETEKGRLVVTGKRRGD